MCSLTVVGATIEIRFYDDLSNGRPRLRTDNSLNHLLPFSLLGAFLPPRILLKSVRVSERLDSVSDGGSCDIAPGLACGLAFWLSSTPPLPPWSSGETRSLLWFAFWEEICGVGRADGEIGLRSEGRSDSIGLRPMAGGFRSAFFMAGV